MSRHRTIKRMRRVVIERRREEMDVHWQKATYQWSMIDVQWQTIDVQSSIVVAESGPTRRPSNQAARETSAMPIHEARRRVDSRTRSRHSPTM